MAFTWIHTQTLVRLGGVGFCPEAVGEGRWRPGSLSGPSFSLCKTSLTGVWLAGPCQVLPGSLGKATSWAAVAEQGWGGKGDLHTRWGLTPPQKSTTELGPQGTSEQSSLLRTSPFSEFPSIQEARSELQGPATYPPLHPMIPCHILMSNCLRQFTFDLSLCPLPYTVGA